MKVNRSINKAARHSQQSLKPFFSLVDNNTLELQIQTRPLMKLHAKHFGYLTLLLLASCQQATESSLEKSEAAKPTLNSGISSAAAIENSTDKNHVFIRTADIKFRAHDVIEATYSIENSVVKHGGFVTHTQLKSQVNEVTKTSVSADSALEVTKFTVVNTMQLRIPNQQLDTTLKEIAANVDFLDYRIIQAEDVALKLKANDLAQSRAIKNEKRLEKTIEKSTATTEQTAPLEATLMQQQAQEDNAKLANLELDDKIAYSTVNIELYQRQTTQNVLIPLEQHLVPFEPSLSTKLLLSFQTGWRIIENLLVFIAQFWSVLLLAGLLFYGYRKFKLYFKQI